MTVHNSNFLCLQRTKKYSQVLINSRCWLSVSSADLLMQTSLPHLSARSENRQGLLYLHMAIIGGSCHKYNFCCDKHVFCCDKSMLVVTKKYSVVRKLLSSSTILSRQKLSRQNTPFIATNTFAETKVCLSWQNFCHDKIMFAATNICRKDMFVTTNIIHDKNTCGSSRQW